MNQQELPEEYDAIIVGTGLTETIVSSALSRIGKTVLHIDENDFYGSENASFTLKNLIEFAKNEEKTTLNKKNLSEKFYLNSFEYKWNIDINEDEFIKNHNRRFTIDLNANLFYSKSKLIDLLIQSDVSKYCEFKLIRSLLTSTFTDNRESIKLERIPTSRSDIFKSTSLTMIEKRLLMKFITSCVEDESTGKIEQSNIDFKNYLNEFNLTQRLRDYILNSIAMCPEDVSATNGIIKCKKYFKSIGRYGDSPFLYQIYGINELSQAFSRLSAVFGGIFYLNLKLCAINSDNIVVNLGNEKERTFKFKSLISNLNYLNYEIIGERFDISKCILVTNKSIFMNDNEISFLYLPKSEKSNEIFIIEVSSSAQVCPNGFYLVYMFCDKKNETAKMDFEEAIGYLYQNSSSNIIFEFYYSQLNTKKTNIKLNENSSLNLFYPNTPTSDLDFDLNVNEAEEIFKKICPNEQFLPKPPDPEDIIFGGENACSQKEKSEETTN